MHRQQPGFNGDPSMQPGELYKSPSSNDYAYIQVYSIEWKKGLKYF